VFTAKFKAIRRLRLAIDQYRLERSRHRTHIGLGVLDIRSAVLPKCNHLSFMARRTTNNR